MANTNKKTGAAAPTIREHPLHVMDVRAGVVQIDSAAQINKAIDEYEHEMAESDNNKDYEAGQLADMSNAALDRYIRTRAINGVKASIEKHRNTRELHMGLLAMRPRFPSGQGKRTDIIKVGKKTAADEFGVPTFGEYCERVGVTLNALRVFNFRNELKLKLENGEPQTCPATPSPAFTASTAEAEVEDTTEREQATQKLLDEQHDAEAKVEQAESEVLTPASNAAPLPPLPGAVYTREQANSDTTMRMTTELVGKHVWLARSADAFVLVLAFDKATAEEIAYLNGVVPVSCTNVNVAETAVIMQGVIDKSRGWLRFSMTDAKNPAQSATTADELVEQIA